jgi:hypothetical protein
MKTIIATDLRMSSPAFSKAEVTYDPAEVEDFDTRGECESMWEETWGQRVEIEDGVLYLTLHGRAENHTSTQHNVLMDR